MNDSVNQKIDLKTLVVDDHLSMRRMIMDYLADLGFTNIASASNGDEATKELTENVFDVVFLDWNMPGKTGYMLLQQCRQDTKYDNSAFVMVTAESHDRKVIEALKAGANSYIIKPFSREHFEKVVKSVLLWRRNRLERKS